MNIQPQLDRLLLELRQGRFVKISADAPYFVMGAEFVRQGMFEAGLEQDALINSHYILLAKERWQWLGADINSAGTSPISLSDRDYIIDLTTGRSPTLPKRISPASQAEKHILDLLQYSLLLPAAVIIKTEHETLPTGYDILNINLSDLVENFEASFQNVDIVSRAQVPLEYSKQCELVVFQGGEGLKNQLALLINQPDLSKPVSIRLHSACLTGDLLGSLKCDCGDQLRNSLQTFGGSDEGGILLYLDQEGRGNGIANKIRAYQMQEIGYDTYEADAFFGLGPDQRRFSTAAAMLKILGVHRVLLHTNNPRKINALKDNGIEVVASTSVKGRVQDFNRAYLDIKRDKGGHKIID